MKGIDANILVRFLLGDDATQAKKVYKVFKAAESSRSELFVPLLVVLELIWVLESVYAISRTAILDAINDLLLMPVLKFEQPLPLQQFTDAARGSKLDLSDLLIACSARQSGCEKVITFDKKKSRSNLFELLL